MPGRLSRLAGRPESRFSCFRRRSRSSAPVAGLGSDVWESVKVEGDSPNAFADPTAFDRILEILLQNALEYGAKPVTVRTNQRDGVLSVDVEDHGRGVDPGFVLRLFEPFSRCEQSRHVREGSGLGLASDARAHGARRAARPAPDAS